MTKVSKNAKLVTTLVLLVLAFLCSFSVTYSYFTASANKSGSLSFPDLNVRFICDDNESFTTLELFPVGGAISRGGDFELSTSANGSAITSLSIKNMENSCEAYVRFWIDAYIIENNVVNTTNNFGKYFSLTEKRDYISRGGTGKNVNTNENWCYFLVYALDKNPSEYGAHIADIGNSLILSEDAPAEMLGSQIKITISLQAVQKANEAYSSVFNDEKGYYSGWAEEE